MRLPILLSAILLGVVALLSTAAQQPQQSDRHPVIVELFTSEGCSSCPPADALLERLDQTQPVPGATIIALSEHVDYWNYIGWTDPWSSSAFSKRQEGYAGRFGLASIYTPQMVVNGDTEAVGTDSDKVRRAVAKASGEEADAIAISPVSKGADGKPMVEVDVTPFSNGAAKQNATVFIAIAENATVSHVLRGENSGRTLRHVAVVRSLNEAGRIGADGKFHKQISLSGDKAQWDGKRLVAFVQDSGFGRIRGSASRVLSAHEATSASE